MQASRPLASEVTPVGGGQWSHLTSSARRANISLPASQFARPPRASRSAKPPSTKPSKPRRRTQSPSVPGPFALSVQISHFRAVTRSEEHTSELQSLMRISYAVFCLKKKNMRQPRIPSTKLYIVTHPFHYNNNTHELTTVIQSLIRI